MGPRVCGVSGGLPRGLRDDLVLQSAAHVGWLGGGRGDRGGGRTAARRRGVRVRGEGNRRPAGGGDREDDGPRMGSADSGLRGLPHAAVAVAAVPALRAAARRDRVAAATPAGGRRAAQQAVVSLTAHCTTPASYIAFPPTSVSTLSVFGSSPNGTVKMSCDKTARSASIPGARVPVSRSASSA